VVEYVSFNITLGGGKINSTPMLPSQIQIENTLYSGSDIVAALNYGYQPLFGIINKNISTNRDLQGLPVWLDTSLINDVKFALFHDDFFRCKKSFVLR
jgi:hypothetical protein